MNCIYGKYPVEAFLRKHKQEAKKLWFVSDKHIEHIDVSLIKDIPKQEIASKELRKRFSLKEFESPQGLVLEIEHSLQEMLYTSLEDLIIQASHNNKILLWLPMIQDSNNLGALVRSCVAFEKVHGIIIPSSKSVNLTPATAKISAGTLFDMKFTQFRSFNTVANSLKASGLKLLALEDKDNPKRIWDVDFKMQEPFALVIGSEEKGIPKNLKSMCDMSISIPQGDNVDSLNLSVATGIMLYEIMKQYSAKDKD